MAEKEVKNLDESHSSSKNKIFIIIGAGALLLIAVVVSILLLMGEKSEPDANGHQGAVELGPGFEASTAKPIFYYNFEEPFIIQVITGKRQRMLQVYVSVTTSNEEDMRIVEVHNKLVRSHIDRELYKVSSDEYNDANGRVRVKERCLNAIQQAMKEEFGKSVVNRVLFTGFVIQ
ncbi:MAG: flagellar basal body-associated FliL family protein [Succinivibrionaceae bacterium]